MKKILLFSDHREIFKTTSKITKGKYKLRWCTYDWLNDDKHFNPDVIIMYFNKKRLNHKFCGISDSSRSSVGSYRIASERNIRHQDIRIPVCEES